jgi:amino acid adenylation domain-containing protein
MSQRESPRFLAGLLHTGLKEHPEAIAIHTLDRSISFRELHKLSNAACFLFQNDYHVKLGDRVAVLAEKSLALVVAAIAIWKAGAIYVPIDSRNALDRTKYILEKVQPVLVISSQQCLAETAACLRDMPRFSYEQIGELSGHAAEPSFPPILASDPAIIIHTSGSTGFPKGAVLSHNSTIVYFHNHNEFLQFDTSSKGMSNGPFHFDVAIQDTFLPLFFGASVLLHRDLFVSSLMVNMMLQMKITHLIAVSSVLELISRDSNKLAEMRHSSLKVLMTGGEVCDPKLINAWLDTIPGLRLLYGYGPTECNSLCMAYQVTEPEHGRPDLYPIGKPFAQMKAVLLDEQGDVIENTHTTGILAIAGPQLMTGYWNDSMQTENVFRFIAGKKYYVTGDRCYRGEEGNYHFVGRNDTEVKLFGRRINLNEIRNALLNHEQVRYAVVNTVHVDGEHRIAAFVHVNNLDRFSFDSLEQTLAKSVPKYMMPFYLCASAQTLNTSTGKISEKLILQRLSETVLENSSTRRFRINEIAS